MDRRIIARLLLVVPLLAAGIALGAPRPAAAATLCNTGPGNFRSDVIRDSVVVEAGTFCGLSGAVVRGGVTVEPGAAFSAQNGTEIRGSVTATAPSGHFVIADSVVRGDLTVTGGTGLGVFAIQDSQVRGDLVVTGNIAGMQIDVLRNTVRGSLVLRDNTAIEILVAANAVEGDLDCAGNNSDPSAGPNPNTVGGAKLGQCANL
jgi:hypothetical protein